MTLKEFTDAMNKLFLESDLAERDGLIVHSQTEVIDGAINIEAWIELPDIFVVDMDIFSIEKYHAPGQPLFCTSPDIIGISLAACLRDGIDPETTKGIRWLVD